jgi:hypothetical protein
LLNAIFTSASQNHRPALLPRQTISDTAGIIGISQNTVKTRMFYASKRLAELRRAQFRNHDRDRCSRNSGGPHF